MSLNRGDQVDWTGRAGRKGEDWHGIVVNCFVDKYEVLWTRSNCRFDTLWKRDDIQFPPPANYRTYEPETKLIICDGGEGRRHPKSNEWGNRYGIPSTE